MRVFTAIDFSKPAKDKILFAIEELKKSCSKGRFTSYDNLHLTLAFLGEKNDSEIEDIIRRLNKIDFERFSLNIGGLGKFTRDGGDIYWIGAKSPELIKLREQVYCLLKDYGIDDRFTPHITLAREAKCSELNLKFSDFKETVSAVTLMKSERINGKLTYTPIFIKPLN